LLHARCTGCNLWLQQGWLMNLPHTSPCIHRPPMASIEPSIACSTLLLLVRFLFLCQNLQISTAGYLLCLLNPAALDTSGTFSPSFGLQIKRLPHVCVAVVWNGNGCWRPVPVHRDAAADLDGHR